MKVIKRGDPRTIIRCYGCDSRLEVKRTDVVGVDHVYVFFDCPVCGRRQPVPKHEVRFTVIAPNGQLRQVGAIGAANENRLKCLESDEFSEANTAFEEDRLRRIDAHRLINR